MPAPPDLLRLDGDEEVVEAATEALAGPLRDAVDRRGRASLALSGGSSPWPVFERLATLDLPWDRVDVHQVDERVVPADDDRRNLVHLRRTLLDRVGATVQAMPVEDADLEAAAGRYAAGLPDRFDVIHLGIGDDGHTASLVPGDPVLDVVDRDVALAGPYQGARRMTLTYPVLDRARRVVWLVRGGAKADALARLLAGDRSIPAGRVDARSAVVVTDLAP